ncbi:hypothetical protein L1N85_13150 [Paenibacillus alkaliterrae]|uniref:hypothetical protein n=1 Tax=Paenibacillus alkaliterrae TaxID=320909 RepID=UPI001F29E393|nr:hypothetical protein [Paenibacillus alkaliterrae]MCF2939371.1 hypothetical protein [Paenibacillus alkaliterrae]
MCKSLQKSVTKLGMELRPFSCLQRVVEAAFACAGTFDIRLQVEDGMIVSAAIYGDQPLLLTGDVRRSGVV